MNTRCNTCGELIFYDESARRNLGCPHCGNSTNNPQCDDEWGESVACPKCGHRYNLSAVGGPIELPCITEGCEAIIIVDTKVFYRVRECR